MSMKENKLKIVWICHFMNQRMREKFGLEKHIREQAPWITIGIEELKKRKDVELHIIAPFPHTLRNNSFSDGNIHYNLIKVGVPFMKRNWPHFFLFSLWTNYYLFNIQVKNIIKKINPDLINLWGAENAYYSSSIFHVQNYPSLISIQGFVSLDNELENKNSIYKKRVGVEKKIMRDFNFFGIEATSMETYLRTFNPNAKMFWFHLPFRNSINHDEVSKRYDLVFFARITKDKGIEDLIKAVSFVKRKKKEISLCIIGHANASYKDYLKKMIEELNLEGNIIFKGFISSQNKMHMEAKKARISVLPTYNDTIPGTIVESMFLGIPVISYKTGGISDLNKDQENIILVEQGNIEKLADEIASLLNDINKQNELAQKALKFAQIEFDNTKSVDHMIQAYKEVIKQYNP